MKSQLFTAMAFGFSAPLAGQTKETKLVSFVVELGCDCRRGSRVLVARCGLVHDPIQAVAGGHGQDDGAITA